MFSEYIATFYDRLSQKENGTFKSLKGIRYNTKIKMIRQELKKYGYNLKKNNGVTEGFFTKKGRLRYLNTYCILDRKGNVLNKASNRFTIKFLFNNLNDGYLMLGLKYLGYIN